jgi:hypothetical protein
LVRMIVHLQDLRSIYKSICDLACACGLYIALHKY